MRLSSAHRHARPGFARQAHLAARFVLGGAFVLAGVLKALDPIGFARTIAAFGLIPKILSLPAAWALVAAEVACGAALILGRRWGLGGVTGLTLLFLAVLGYGMAIGLNVDCGCYGPGDPEGEALGSLYTSFVRDLGFLALAAFLHFQPRMGGRAERAPSAT